MPTKVVIDCSTGIATEVELTAEEIAQHEADVLASTQRRAAEEVEAQAKSEAKASALAKLGVLGLTEEEANALIS